MKKIFLIILLTMGQVASLPVISAPANQFDARTGDIVWTEQNKQGETIVHLYVYWSLTCPHCEKALPLR